MFHRQSRALYCLCMGVGLIGVLGSVMPILSDAEESLGLHLLYALRGPEKTPTDVVVVAIDGKSAGALNLALNPQQWPRVVHSQLIEELTRRDAAVVAFDLLFEKPQDTANDLALAKAMRSAGNVVLSQAINRQNMALSDQGGVHRAQVLIERVISAVPMIADAAAAQAPFPLPKVPVKLNQFWCFRPESGNLPTLPVVALHIYAKEAFVDFIRLLTEVHGHLADALGLSETAEFDVRTMIGMIRPLRAHFEANSTLASRALAQLDASNHAEMPADALARVRAFITLYGSGSSRYLNFYGPPGSLRTISYYRLVMAPAPMQPTPYKLGSNLAYFVGQTGSAWIKIQDGFYTPFSGASGRDTSGVEIAATAFANLLEGKGVFPLNPVPSLFLHLGWGMLVVMVSFFSTTAFSVSGLVLINGIYFMIALAQFKSSGIWYPLIVPILVQTPVAFILGLIRKHRQATIERKNIREAFGYYLPDDVVDRLSTNLKTLNLGGQVFYGVCLFTDAQNYTTLSESMDPGSLTDLMNAYYEAVFRPIKNNGGLILQVVGDSVMALWTASAPQSEIKHAACMAAVEIAAAVDQFNRHAGAHAMPTRIGIHAGEMLLGNIGAMNHFEYRPVGDIVNTASRLEGLNKFLGTHVLVSHEAISQDNGFVKRSVGRFVFKGKSHPVGVYELFAPDQYTTNQEAEVVRLFASGLVAFQNGQWEAAEQFFNQALRIAPTDGPTLFYIKRCREYIRTPPDRDWDGVIRLDQK